MSIVRSLVTTSSKQQIFLVQTTTFIKTFTIRPSTPFQQFKSELSNLTETTHEPTI